MRAYGACAIQFIMARPPPRLGDAKSRPKSRPRYIPHPRIPTLGTGLICSEGKEPQELQCDLAVKLLHHPTLSPNSDDLATIGIEIVTMEIKTGTLADSGPQFCHLYPRREFDAMFKMVDEWPQLKELRGGGDSDDRLRWSEVCWATSLMAGRLRERQYQAHGIVPVSMYRYTNATCTC
jgi:hypothetical protein